MYVFFISYLIRLPLMGSTEANRWIYVHTMEWKMGNFIWTNRENGRFLLCVFFCCCCFYCWLLAARCTENKFIYKQCMINDFLGFFSVSSANLVPVRMQQESDMAWTIYVPAFHSYVFFAAAAAFGFLCSRWSFDLSVYNNYDTSWRKRTNLRSCQRDLKVIYIFTYIKIYMQNKSITCVN